MYERNTMKISRIGAIFGAGLLSMSLLTGCGGGGDKPASGTDTESSEPTSTLSGTVTGSGSSALLPLAKAAADAFMQENPDVTVTMNGGGSGEGLKQVAAGSVNIGNSDVFAGEKLDATQAADLVDHKVCTITMAPVVNKDLGVKDLTTAQLTDIFTGKTTNWKEVGGPDEKIVLVTRPASSGTRALFKTWALNGAEEASNQSLETDDSGTLLQTVTQNKGAIGYVALSYLAGKDEVQPVAIDGVEPTLENTYNGKYQVWGFEHMYTKGDPDEVTKAFLDYMMGDKFAGDLEKMGYGVSSKMSKEATDSHPDPAA